MSVTEEGSVLYNIAFALITGAVASFFVAIIVELSSNYRHNIVIGKNIFIDFTIDLDNV